MVTPQNDAQSRAGVGAKPARGRRGQLAILVALCVLGRGGVGRSQQGDGRPGTEAGPVLALPLPEPLPDMAERSVRRPSPLAAAAGTAGEPIRLAGALAGSLRNVETVQANLQVRTATIARFEALKAFVPIVNLPMFAIGINAIGTNPATSRSIIFPDISGGTPFITNPGVTNAEVNRFNIFLPLDPSGQVTALPIAEEGIRGKEVMEQLVRRSQAVLAAQRYFEAKQVQYRLVVAAAGAELAESYIDYYQRRRAEKQAHDVEVSQAEVDAGRARVLLANVEVESAITQRRLGVAVHQCRLLVPPELGPPPTESAWAYRFDLACPDNVDLGFVPDFPGSREEAIARARRQRLEVRLMIIGTRIAQLQKQRDRVRLFGMGSLPLGLSFKNTTPANGGVAFGLLFGTIYDLPVTNLGLWARLRQARLDVVLSQVALERSLLETAEDAGTSWDRWQQAGREWQQKEAEYRLRVEYRDRAERLYREKQAIPLDVAAADLNLLQADTDRWTAWYNLQLARLDILRATELLLDYVEKAGITAVPGAEDAPRRASARPGIFHRVARAGRVETTVSSGKR